MSHPLSRETLHWAFLTTVYGLTEMADTNGVQPARVREVLSLTEDEADIIVDSLVRAGVIVWPAEGEILMTELGVRTVEQSERTTHAAFEKSRGFSARPHGSSGR
jgi:hypothetical protein